MAVGSPSKNNAPLSGFHLFFTSDQGLHAAENAGANWRALWGLRGGALLCEQKNIGSNNASAKVGAPFLSRADNTQHSVFRQGVFSFPGFSSGKT